MFVWRLPSRIVPPMCVFEPSGMKITTGLSACWSISVLFASSMCKTLRAYSITETCMPRQIPKKGTLFNLAYWTANIFPCTPRAPNPPGIKIPWQHLSSFHAFEYRSLFARILDGRSGVIIGELPPLMFEKDSPPPSRGDSTLDGGCSRSTDSSQTIFNFNLSWFAACFKALITDKYESDKPVYFPTTAMRHSLFALSSRMTIAFQFGMRSAGILLIFSVCRMISRTRCFLKRRGTW
mmetsp:Transcript_11679/g.18719  ORF Transcript_11679/g.18719 Transcript_11679/m.18719 type:complete len:237 (+) Transcript_11679:575-1285(+)